MKELKSKDNKIIKYISRLNSSASFRKKEKRFLCEGSRLCVDALKSGAMIHSAFFAETSINRYAHIIEELENKGIEIYALSDSLFKSISETQTPQGIIFLCEMMLNNVGASNCKTSIALECIQDPQNMGTILRSAEAFGIDCVILSKDCCDIFNPKVLRGSMGAVFRQKFIIADDFYSLITNLKNNGVNTYAAVPRDGQDLLSPDFSDPSCVLIGNEGNGLTDKAINLCDSKLTIRMDGNAESLNAAVASSIIMWEMVRRRQT